MSGVGSGMIPQPYEILSIWILLIFWIPRVLK